MSVRSLRYNTIEQHFTKGVTASTDRDALAFLEAAQIYNTNQQRAIVNLVRSLKRVGLWSKIKAIYPFVGGTATSHKWNLKDPRDADAAFRLTFSGGWTHSSNGADPNGTNAWAQTNFKPADNMTNSSAHGSIYVRQNVSNNGVDFGTGGNSGTTAFDISASEASNTFQADIYDYVTNRITATNTDTRGYYISSRTSTTVFKAFKNGSQIGSTNTATSTGASAMTHPVHLAAFGVANSPVAFTSREMAFVTFGDGLTDTDATNLYNIVDLYQRRLGRNV